MQHQHPATAPEFKMAFAAFRPEARIVCAVAWVFLVALLPASVWEWQGMSAGLLVFLSFCVGLPWRPLLGRALLLLPFVLLTAVGLLGRPDWPWQAANLWLKATLSLWIMSLLVHLTPPDDLLQGLRKLRIPKIWVELIAFLFRYMTVFGEEWRRMHLARQARCFRPGRQRQWHGLAASLGSLFIRAFERAERVHRAMLARGYQPRDYR